jgi:hypothetical protein
LASRTPRTLQRDPSPLRPVFALGREGGLSLAVAPLVVARLTEPESAGQTPHLVRHLVLRLVTQPDVAKDVPDACVPNEEGRGRRSRSDRSGTRRGERDVASASPSPSCSITRPVPGREPTPGRNRSLLRCWRGRRSHARRARQAARRGLPQNLDQAEGSRSGCGRGRPLRRGCRARPRTCRGCCPGARATRDLAAVKTEGVTQIPCCAECEVGDLATDRPVGSPRSSSIGEEGGRSENLFGIWDGR